MLGRTLRSAISACLVSIPGLAFAQGLLVDRRPDIPIAGSFEVREVTVDGKIKDQVAEIQVSQVFHNPGSDTIQSEYLFPVPDEGAIQNFVLLVDGKELPGELMDKEKARRIFEEIVRRKKDPALLEYMGTGLIKTSVFPIPPGADRKVTMRFTKLLDRDRDIVEFSYPFATQKFTSKPISRLELNLRIDSKTPIKSVYSPSHEVEKKLDGDHEAKVSLTQRDVIPTRDFRLFYTLGEGAVGASVLSYRPSADDDGYFLLLASPELPKGDAKDKRPKTVVFVLDRSGSMSGKKIEQARDALKFVMNNLNEGDTFNIVVYDDRVETYRPELQRYDRDAREEALRYVENIRPGGSTNIEGALTSALEMIPDDSDRPGYVLFLTDGLPTAGETNELKIAQRAKEANEHDARVFSFGVGNDVNARLLDRLSEAHGGATEYVTPDQDIEAEVARFYSKLTSPVLTGLAIDIDGTDVNRTYPRDLPDLFEGGQLVWVGRYSDAGEAKVHLRGKVAGESKSFDYDIDLAKTGKGSSYAFVETLWALRRVGYIIDQIDLNGPSTELTDELVALSTKHGILTPYTSFLADETTELHARVENRRLATDSLSQLSAVQGATGVGQRENKAFYMRNDQAQAGVLSESLARAPSSAPAGADGVAAKQRAQGLSRGARGSMMGSTGGLGGQKPGSGARAYGSLGPRSAGASVDRFTSMFGSRAGAPVIGKDLEGEDVLIANVRQIGGKTFYFRNDRWVDSDVKPDDEARAKVVVQFSDDYFALTRKQSAEQNQYLSFAEPVTVKIGSDIYKVDLAPAK